MEDEVIEIFSVKLWPGASEGESAGFTLNCKGQPTGLFHYPQLKEEMGRSSNFGLVLKLGQRTPLHIAISVNLSA